MGADIRLWPKSPAADNLPHRIMRPCDAQLTLTVMDLEIQLGTVEGYNRLVEAAERMKARIDGGDTQPPNPIYARNIKGESQ
jgi:hypothetical protein